MRDTGTSWRVVIAVVAVLGLTACTGGYDLPDRRNGFDERPEPTGPASGEAPPCATGALEFADGGGTAATGHRRAIVLATNVSAAACALAGYPDVVFRDVDGRPAGAVSPGGGFMNEDPGPATVVLEVGATAMADFTWDAGAGAAPGSASIQASPGTGWVDLALPWSGEIAGGAPVAVAAWQPAVFGMFDD